MKLPQGGGDLAGALDRVEEIVARARQQNPRLATAQVYFLTDLGRTSWDLAAVTSGPRIREQLARLAATARLSVVDLGQEHCENLAVTDLQAVQPICTTHAPVDLRAEVRNFGGQTQKCSVELLIDGQRVQEQSIAVAAHAKQTVPFAYRFTAPGEHAVEAIGRRCGQCAGNRQPPLAGRGGERFGRRAGGERRRGPAECSLFDRRARSLWQRHGADAGAAGAGAGRRRGAC